MQLPEYIYIKVFETDENVSAGKFVSTSGFQLRYIRARLLMQGAVTSNLPRIRAVITTNSDQSNAYAASEWVKLKDLYDYSIVHFEFNGETINPDVQFGIVLETQNYTRNQDELYLASVIDYPLVSNDTASGGYVDNKGPNFALIGEVF